MAFIGIPVPHEVGRLIRNLQVPGIKEMPSEYHITLLVFEKNWSIKNVLKAIDTTYQVVSQMEPFTVKINKVSHFPSYNDQPIPIIAPVKSEQLYSLHKQLSKAFDKDKIDYKKTFKEYKPHITLSYSEDKHDDFTISPALQFAVNEVVLWGGDDGDTRLFTTFQLKSPERKKHAALLNKMEVFEKITDSFLK